MPPYIVKASEIKLTVIDCKNGMECAENHNKTIGTFKIRRFFNEKKNYIVGFGNINVNIDNISLCRLF